MITHFLLEVLRIPCCFFPLTLHQDTLTVAAAAALSPLPYPFLGWFLGTAATVIIVGLMKRLHV